MNLVILEPAEVAADGTTTLADARAAHLLQVLKVSAGQAIRVGLLDGPLGTGTVTHASTGRVALACVFETVVPPRPDVDLLLALPRPKVMKRLWAQLAALGVGRIVLTNAQRVERDYFDTHVLAATCYRPLLVEGLQQACDTRLPLVSIHRRFRVLVEDELDGLTDAGVRLIADPGVQTSVRSAVGPRTDRVLMAVGPEGGWNAFERALLEARGFIAVGMGPRTLRTDTACLALVTLAHEAIAAGAGERRMAVRQRPSAALTPAGNRA